MRLRTCFLTAILVCSALGGCGGDDKPSTPKPTPTKQADDGPSLPKDPPKVTVAERRQLDRCVRRWNATIGRADPKTAHGAIAERANEDADGLLATVTVYAGKAIKERRDNCVVVVSQGATVFAPFSRVGGRWVASCAIAGAEPDPDEPRQCSSYTEPLSRQANATFSADGRLELRTVSE